MNKLLNKSKMFLNRNSSTILTCMVGAGVVTTAVMSATATPKAIALLEEAEKEKGEALTKLEKVKVAAPVYIPAILAGGATIACAFGANILSKRHQASIMSAYALLDQSYKDHKKKVEELYGEEALGKISEEIAKDKYEETDISVSDDKILFYDEFSGQYFESTIEAVQQAEYNINRDLSMRDYATVNEFYDYLNIPHIDGGDDLGWSTGMNFEYCWQSWIDFTHRKVIIDDDLECRIITMCIEPTLEWCEYY